MNLTDIANLRLINQQIEGTKFTTAKDIVGWMGAIQAQDFSMAKWAIGIRLPNSTEKLIDTAIDSGEIIRTHLLRPTLHFVSADDIYWMLELTAPQIKASMKSRDKKLELTETIYRKSNSILGKALKESGYLSRKALVTELEKANIATDNNRASHLLMRGELDGIICSGKTIGNKQTYALLTERMTKTKTLKRDEALSKLALKYFTSHSPATLQDFTWWSGLSMTEAKHALETIKSNFVAETIGKQTYWITNSFPISKPNNDSVYVLPAFDEFIISYKDRTAILPFENQIKAVSNNGIFRPVIVINGQVTGTWKRITKKDKVLLETALFMTSDKATKNLIEKAFLPFAHFINKKTEIVYCLQ